MRLRQIIDQRRAEVPAAALLSAHACFELKPAASVLDVITSGGDVWQFPWQQFTSARHGKEGEQDSSVLTFTTHIVTLGGFHFSALREAIREGRLALLRVSPTKYVKTADGELFVTALHVQPVEEIG